MPTCAEMPFEVAPLGGPFYVPPQQARPQTPFGQHLAKCVAHMRLFMGGQRWGLSPPSGDGLCRCKMKKHRFTADACGRGLRMWGCAGSHVTHLEGVVRLLVIEIEMDV